MESNMENTMRSGPKRIIDKMNDPVFVASLPKSREEALAVGATKYLSNKVCPHNHNSYRLTKNGSCGQCASNLANKHSNVTRRDKKATDKKWNNSEKAKDAKQRWKERDPKWAWVVSAVGAARGRARWAGLAFDLTNDYIYGITPDTCPVFNVPFVFIGVGSDLNVNPSIDRIDPAKGYVIGNVAVISRRANMIKSNATLAELHKVADWLQTQGI